MNAYDILKERGFIAQVTYEDDLRKAFDEGMVTFYTGFDPTADSLHIGHYIPIMAMAHLQRAGHKPIALMGGGTGMIGDPSGKSMEYLDPTTNERFIPYCVEPSLGVDRAVLAFLCNAYDEEELEGGDVRTVLHLHPALAPFTVSVMPLQKNKLGEQARALYAKLAKKFRCDYDETGSIGKRYRRADEIGTPYCICVDFDTESTGNVTVRDRDTMQQEVVAIDNLIPWLESKLEF